MSKIQSIHISNFKFFANHAPIVLDGKHLLLYGENGSGKSSFSYALYTLLEAAAKQADEVKKYFDVPANSNESLVNIWAELNDPHQTGAFVEVVDDSGNRYKVSYGDTVVCGDAQLLESNRASDFINYQSIFRFQLFRNSEKMDLVHVFKHSILPYISFPLFPYRGKDLTNAADIYKKYHQGPGYREGGNIVNRNSPEYQEFLALEKHFNREMHKLVDFINANYEEVIQYLGYDFKVQLAYKDTSHSKKRTWVKYNDFGLAVTMVEYEGQQMNNPHPNIFLNEAKMSALAIAIRWALLKYRLNGQFAPSALKFIVLDDVMISLDMGNRYRMIDLILDKMTEEFQVLFLTHDRLLYDCVKQKLLLKYKLPEESHLSKNNWILLEMYDAKIGSHHVAQVQSAQSILSKAWNYFNGGTSGIDYNACGNMLRQALEERFRVILKKLNATAKDGKTIDYTKTMLDAYIQHAQYNFERVGLPTSVLDTLKTLTTFLLNPTSHYNPHSNFYRNELETAFEIYYQLEEYEAMVLIPQGEELLLSFDVSDEGYVKYAVCVLEDVLLVKEHTEENFRLSKSACNFKIKQVLPHGGEWHATGRKTFQELYDDTIQHYIKQGKTILGEELDVHSKFSYQGNSLHQLLEHLYL